MYLYKLPKTNEYIFVKEKSLYNLYQPNALSDHLLVPEKIYRKHEESFGHIPSEEFNASAFESLKDQFLRVFSSNQLSSLQRMILSFFIQQYKISKEQYADALQKILAESHSFDIQVQLARYETIKKQYPTSFIDKWRKRFHL